jgi:hypothetical protein
MKRESQLLDRLSSQCLSTAWRKKDENVFGDGKSWVLLDRKKKIV